MTRFDYDLIALGAGSGGVRAARMAAQAGKRVAVVESSRVGGTCVMRGCVPKKLLVMGSHFADDLADAEGFGWSIEGADFDWARLVASKNEELARLEAVYRRILAESGVILVAGHGRLLDPHHVVVEGKVITAQTVLIATGARPDLPDIPGIGLAITSDQALDLMQLPRSLAILGGGYIAVEFAGIFSALGVEVTLVIRGDAPLRGFDGDLRNGLAEEMQRRGIRILPHTTVTAITRQGPLYRLDLAQGDMLEADLVFAATGRIPNTDGLGLTETGIALDARGAVVVDDHSRTTVENVWAVGDVTNRKNLTPVAIAEAMAFVRTAFLEQPSRPDYAHVPSAVFSQPPLATVGLSEAQAREAGHDLHVYVSRFRPMRHVLAGRDEKTLVKLVVDAATDRVLGVHMLGQDSPEIMQGFAVALKCGATKAQFDATIGIHPTSAEELVTMRERRP